MEDISGVETVKAYGARRMRNEQGESRLLNLARSIFSLQMLNLSVSTLSGLGTGLAGLVILWYGGHRVISGALTIGELMFFYTLLGYMLDPLLRLASVNHQIQDALVAVDRLYQILDLQVEQGDHVQRAEMTGVVQAIELRDVSFRYGCRDDVLKKISLSIPAGSTVAIVGESGCGKSTLLKLLMRFYDPTSHLDTATERAIQRNLQSVFADRTVILVAHRLSTIRDADMIYLMHEGRIAEQGDHRQLLAQGGRYAELCRAQAGEDWQFVPHANGAHRTNGNGRLVLSSKQ